MATDPNPVTDRAGYIDKVVEGAAGKAPPAKPAPPPPPPPPPHHKSQEEQDADDAIYGPGAHSSGQASNAGSAAQSTDSYNKY